MVKFNAFFDSKRTARWDMTLDTKQRKVIIGFALAKCISILEFDSALSDVYGRIDILYEKIDQAELENLYDFLIASSNGTLREIGFHLEPLIVFKESKMEWRDLVIEMLETEISLFNIFHMLTTSSNVSYDTHDLLEWLNDLGSSANHMKVSNFTGAKIHASRAYEHSLNQTVENMLTDPYIGGAIDQHRRETAEHFQTAKRFPVHFDVSEGRVDTILEVQEIFIEFLKKYHLDHPDKVLSDVILYPIEKLGTAIDYILDSKRTIEEANYELGLASEHIKEKSEGIHNPNDLKWATAIHQKIECLFSKLPAKPWPVKGFGFPGVESRFDDEGKRSSSR